MAQDDDSSSNTPYDSNTTSDHTYWSNAFENAAVGMSFIDLNGRFLRVNRCFCEMVGYAREELLGRPFREITHPEDNDLDGAQYALLIGGKVESYNVEKRYIRKNGTDLWSLITRSMQRDNSGNPLYSIAIVQDITTRKQVEEQFRQVAQFPEQNPNPVLRVSNEGGLLYANRVANEKLIEMGWHAGRLVPKQFQKLIQEALKSGGVVEREIECIGGTVFSFTTTPIEHSGYVNLYGNDVTERKRAEKELTAAKTSAERAKAAAEKANHAKDHFLAVLSHELRTPLTPIVMGVSILQGRLDLDSTVRETLEMVRQNAEMEARLIDDLLDVTRIARGKVELHPSHVGLDKIIQRAVEVCRSDIEARGLNFRADLGPAAPYWIEADVSRLQQVFWNLLKNAIKFTPHGGFVGIRCRSDEEHVVIEVNDSGIGMEPGALLRVFNAFEQAENSISRQFGGLGLGLAISKALVEMHGGTIEALSDGPGRGATFRVRLPLSKPAGKPERIAPASSPQQFVRPLRILLVEDHGVTAQMLHVILSEKGHAVERAGDVCAALDLADRHAFDLLISDLGLPDQSGYDLIRELRLRGHKFPGIALSGYGQEQDIQQSFRAGFVAHLTKPASREAIYEAIASAAADGRQAAFMPTTSDSSDAPVFDADLALRQCLGKHEMFEQMVNFFRTNCVNLLSQIRRAFGRCDIPETGRAAHMLRGTVSYLGAQPAADAAERTERAARSGDLKAAARAILTLEHQMELLKNALNSRAAKPKSV